VVVKTAIYVADGLWNAMRDLYPSDGDSALVQRGLRALAREWEGTPEFDDLLAEVGREAIFGTDDA